MIHFVPNARHDRYFALSEIVEIGAGKRSSDGYGYYHEARLRDGGTFTMSGTEADALLNPVLAVLPAAPGYSVIHTGEQGGTEWVNREPIIAWQALADGTMRPITVEGERDNMLRDVPIEKPNGAISIRRRTVAPSRTPPP